MTYQGTSAAPDLSSNRLLTVLIDFLYSLCFHSSFHPNTA